MDSGGGVTGTDKTNGFSGAVSLFSVCSNAAFSCAICAVCAGHSFSGSAKSAGCASARFSSRRRAFCASSTATRDCKSFNLLANDHICDLIFSNSSRSIILHALQKRLQTFSQCVAFCTINPQKATCRRHARPHPAFLCPHPIYNLRQMLHPAQPQGR